MSTSYIRDIKKEISLDVQYYHSLCHWKPYKFTKRVLRLLLKKWLKFINRYRLNKSLFYRLKAYIENLINKYK